MRLRALGRPHAPGAVGVVLVPGIEGAGDTFAPLQPLSQRVPLWTLDLPATGTVHALGRSLVDALPPGRHLVVGASFGGLVARCAAEQAPSRVGVLAGIGALPRPLARPARLRVQARALEALPDALARRLYRRRISRRLEEEGVTVERAAAHLRHLPSPPVLAGRLRAVAGWRPSTPPPVPTWWLVGQTDREAPWSLQQAAAALPGAEVETIPGGHRPWLTHDGALRALLEQLHSNVVAGTRG